MSGMMRTLTRAAARRRSRAPSAAPSPRATLARRLRTREAMTPVVRENAGGEGWVEGRATPRARTRRRLGGRRNPPRATVGPRARASREPTRRRAAPPPVAGRLALVEVHALEARAVAARERTEERGRDGAPPLRPPRPRADAAAAFSHVMNARTAATSASAPTTPSVEDRRSALARARARHARASAAASKPWVAGHGQRDGSFHRSVERWSREGARSPVSREAVQLHARAPGRRDPHRSSFESRRFLSHARARARLGVEGRDRVALARVAADRVHEAPGARRRRDAAEQRVGGRAREQGRSSPRARGEAGRALRDDTPPPALGIGGSAGAGPAAALGGLLGESGPRRLVAVRLAERHRRCRTRPPRVRPAGAESNGQLPSRVERRGRPFLEPLREVRHAQRTCRAPASAREANGPAVSSCVHWVELGARHLGPRAAAARGRAVRGDDEPLLWLRLPARRRRRFLGLRRLLAGVSSAAAHLPQTRRGREVVGGAGRPRRRRR